jgi:hypothetical protein
MRSFPQGDVKLLLSANGLAMLAFGLFRALMAWCAYAIQQSSILTSRKRLTPAGPRNDKCEHFGAYLFFRAPSQT